MNQGPNKSTYKKALQNGEQLVICGDRAYLHPSMEAVDLKAAEKLAKSMTKVSEGFTTGELFYQWIKR